MSCPCVVHPDPRYVDEDELDRIRKENEALEKKRVRNINNFFNDWKKFCVSLLKQIFIHKKV